MKHTRKSIETNLLLLGFKRAIPITRRYTKFPFNIYLYRTGALIIRSSMGIKDYNATLKYSKILNTLNKLLSNEL